MQNKVGDLGNKSEASGTRKYAIGNLKTILTEKSGYNTRISKGIIKSVPTYGDMMYVSSALVVQNIQTVLLIKDICILLL
jgi:hypothetical protein